MPQRPDVAKRELWWKRLRDFERGNATVTQYCRRIGVPVWSFYYWQQKLRSGTINTASNRARHAVATPTRRTRRRRFAPLSRDAVMEKPELTFLPIEIAGSRLAGIEVHLPNGTRITVPCDDHHAIGVVLAALLNHPQEQRSC